MKRFAFIAASLALLAVNCGGEPNEGGAVEAEAELITISWTVPSETAENAVRTTRITQAQADWLHAARTRARARLRDGALPVVETPPVAEPNPSSAGTARSALVTGSPNWSDCVSLEWFLMTSGPDATGTIYCAKHSTTTGFNSPIVIGAAVNRFTPRWFDPASQSDAIFNICSSSANCVLTQCCQPGGSCSGIWRSFFRNSVGGNISPPAFSGQSIFAQMGVFIC